ncbi:hypothetical protein T01_12592 [Trichinella spiralis]|uniref:Uncharacterized protein n=1 Tax=Trichinella spiralis TaxID=6334 RepID=A0A0V1BVN4_TRISP|nr:hypothetical protein T01_12592 [Trichinella spiralis]
MKEKQPCIRKMFYWQWQFEIKQVKQLSLTRLFSAESLGFPRSREGERALCLPKEQGSLHSPLSKGRELHAPGWGPFLVSPSSTCIKYFKSHFRHSCVT